MCVHTLPHFHASNSGKQIMTNPNQLCEVLLLVCSKTANLSSKLPVTDGTTIKSYRAAQGTGLSVV